MDREELEPSACNGEKHSAYPGSKVVESDKEEAEEEEEEDGETNALLTTKATNGCLAGKKRSKNGKRRVQWNDCNGDNLVEVMEFDPSDSSDSDEDLSHEISIWEQVITRCMHFMCCCPCNQRSRT